MEWLWIAMGGAIGASARAGLGQMVGRWAGMSFPWATLAINVLGCLAMGLLDGLLSGRPGWEGSWQRPLLAAGLLGGFTTFSAFGLETIRMFQRDAAFAGTAYVLLSVFLGLGAVPLGQLLARQVGGHEPRAASTSGTEASEPEHPQEQGITPAIGESPQEGP